jgi:predicted NACHT family NTPase
MSVRASEQKGIRKAREALTRKGWKQTKLLEEAKSRNHKLSSQQLSNFFQGKAVARSTADKIGFLLDLAWEDGDLEPALRKRTQNNGTDIDELVREVRSRCCDKVQHLYSKIQLLNRQQIDVDELYVDVYVLEKLASESYATIPDLLKGSDLRDGFDRLGLGKREKRSPGFEVAAQYPRLMILGKPGAGKTTFLRHLAIACCKDEFLADHIPILIELRDINASEFNLLNHIHQEFDLANEEQTKQILKQGKVLILLDGLDEVPNLSRREVQDHIYKFSQFQHYYKNRFILTCRTQTIEYISDKFKPVEVADFNPEQVEFFALNWFTALAETPEQGATLKAHFMAKLRLPQNKPTAELAVTPILLSLTCWVFDYLKDLPPKRSDLYEQGINLLLEKWDKKRGVRRELGSEAYRKLSVGEKKKLLSYLAARKFQQEQYILFEQGELQGYIAEYLDISTEDSEAVLDAVAAQHGLLIEQAQGFWSFSHLTFQEYFTAKWFCDRAALYGWKDLVSHITDKHWREVFLLAVGMLQRADCLLQLIKQQVDAILADDEELQHFLIWANNKSITVERFHHKLATLRGSYIKNDNQLAVNIAGGSFALFSNSEMAIDQFLISDLNLVLAWDNHLNGKDEVYHIVQYDRSYLFQNAIRYTSDSKLKEALQLLKAELQEADESKDKFKVWWEFHGQAWIKKLRSVMKPRNIGHDWQFSLQQEERVKQYYDANILLVDCLNSGCVVSDGVRKEIEETLLLPFDEIEKRQPQM